MQNLIAQMNLWGVMAVDMAVSVIAQMVVEQVAHVVAKPHVQGIVREVPATIILVAVMDADTRVEDVKVTVVDNVLVHVMEVRML